MSVTPDILRRLAKLNLDPTALAEVLSIMADMQETDEERRRKQRERTAKHRRNVTVTSPNGGGGGGADVTLQRCDCNSDPPPPSPEPPSPAPVHPQQQAHTRMRTREVAEDWKPKPEVFERAVQTVLFRDKLPIEECRHLVEHEAMRFVVHSRSRGLTYADLGAGFLSFLTRPNRPRAPPQAASPTLSVVNGAKSHASHKRTLSDVVREELYPDLAREGEEVRSPGPLLLSQYGGR